MIEIFKTNVEEFAQAARIIELLSAHFPVHKINFDLQDCDKILRVEGVNFMPENVIALVVQSGFHCRVLD